MKRLQTNFKELENETKHILKSFTLNKSEPHWNPVGGPSGWGDHTKGVKNDFTKVLIPLNRNNDISCSFVINYIGLETESFIAQIKKGNDNTNIKSTKVLEYDDFRKKLNTLINTIKDANKNQPITYPEFVKIFSNLYLSEDLDLNKQAKIAEKELMDFLQTPKQHLNEKKESYLKSKLLVEKIEEEIIQNIKNSAEQSELDKLLERVKEVKENIAKNKQELENSKGLKNLKKNLKANESEYLKAEKSFNEQKKAEIKKYPKSIGILIK